MKTYVLMISKHFMKDHPRAGELTMFRYSIQNGDKIHTLRANYDYWAHVAEEVNAGRGVLSLRQWSGKPYRSKHEEFMRLANMGVQRASVTVFLFHQGTKGGVYGTIKVDSKEIQHYREFYTNDGFSSAEDFANWFGACIYENMALIHFTDFRY